MTITLTKTRSLTMMSKADAMRIQAEQIEHYARCYGSHVRELVAAATTAHLLADGEHDMAMINRHIPRGGSIEWLIPEKRAAEEAIEARRAAMED
jgi:hypothetical protein